MLRIIMKNKLRISFLGFFILFSHFLWSQTNPNGYSSMFNGVYGGLGLGVMATKAKLNSNTSATLFNSISPIPFEIQNNLQKNNSGDLDGFLMLSVGAGRLINNSNFYAGIEGFFNPSTGSIIYTESSASYNNSGARTFIFFPTANTKLTQKNYSYGADLKLGHVFNKITLAYVRVGVGFNRTNITSNNILSYRDDSSFPLPFVTTFSYLNVNKIKTLPAIRLGVGGEYAITDALHVNVDVIYTGYKSLKANGTNNTISPLNDQGDSSVVRPNGFSNSTRASNMQNVAALIGLKYYI